MAETDATATTRTVERLVRSGWELRVYAASSKARDGSGAARIGVIAEHARAPTLSAEAQDYPEAIAALASTIARVT